MYKVTLTLKSLLNKSLSLVFIAVAVMATACAKSDTGVLELIKTIPVRSSDEPQYAHLSWSPISLAWSPDGKRIAYTSTGLRRFGVIDIETGKNTEIVSEYLGSAVMLWAQNANRLVLIHSTSFVVFDMSQEPAKRLYAIENKFPKLLSPYVNNGGDASLGIVSLQGKDHLVLVGTTNWRIEPTNPHIAVYDIETGQRVERFSYQFNNEPYDKQFPVRQKNGGTSFTPWRAKVGMNSIGEILVTTYASRDTSNSTYENVLFVVNLNTQKTICQFEIQQDHKDADGKPNVTVYTRHYLASNAIDTNFLYSGPYKQVLYNAENCQKIHNMPENYGDKNKGTVAATNTRISSDGRWIFGFDYNETHKDKAPFKLWQLNNGKLMHDGY